MKEEAMYGEKTKTKKKTKEKKKNRNFFFWASFLVFFVLHLHEMLKKVKTYFL